MIEYQIAILTALMAAPNPLDPLAREFLVVCLCAAWCGTCREYETGFRELEARHPEVGFVWVDIEDENAGVEDWDIENFPTLLIQRKELVLFFGPMLPNQRILVQTLEAFIAQGPEEARAYAHATPERAAWQAGYNYRSLRR